MTALLEVENLEASYGLTKVLHGVDFKVEDGGITTILGANGAGKTTSLRSVSAMVDTVGKISFAGQSIEEMSTEGIARLGIAHVPDGRGTFVNLSVEENLKLGAYTRKGKEAVIEDYERVYRYFPVLEERKTQQAGLLSGGEQQMLAIARAIMLRPKLLLLDEPSFGLAPLLVREIFKNMHSINKEEGVSMLVVEQNASLALNLADYAYLLETGKVVLSGSSEEIQNDDSVRRSYLGY